jgi:hypothetical protein
MFSTDLFFLFLFSGLILSSHGTVSLSSFLFSFCFIWFELFARYGSYPAKNICMLLWSRVEDGGCRGFFFVFSELWCLSRLEWSFSLLSFHRVYILVKDYLLKASFLVLFFCLLSLAFLARTDAARLCLASLIFLVGYPSFVIGFAVLAAF